MVLDVFPKSPINSNPLIFQGGVLLLDALGVRDFSAQQCVDFIYARNYIFGGLAGLQKGYENTFIKTGKEPKRSSTNVMFGGYFSTFGDTICLTFPMKNIGNNVSVRQKKDYVSAVGGLLVGLIPLGWDKGVLLRGAFGSGEFVVDKSTNTILGPAISQAAKTHEAVDWMGVVMSMGDGDFWGLDKNSRRYCVDKVIPVWVKYDCPIKPSSQSNGSKKEFWAFGWPIGLIYNFRGNIDEARDRIVRLKAEKCLSKKDEPKYDNTLEFFDFFVKEHWQWFLKRSKKH